MDTKNLQRMLRNCSCDYYKLALTKRCVCVCGCVYLTPKSIGIKLSHD